MYARTIFLSAAYTTCSSVSHCVSVRFGTVRLTLTGAESDPSPEPVVSEKSGEATFA